MGDDRGQRATSELPPRRGWGRVWRVVGPVLLAFSVVLLSFAIYELIELRWLRDRPDLELHTIHRVRGVTLSLVAAVLAAWLIVRMSPQLLRVPISAPEGVRQLRLGADEERRRYADWFIGMRWVAVVVASTLIFVTVSLLHLLPRIVLWPLLGGVAVLAALNVAYAAVAARPRQPPYFLALQAQLDLVILAVLLHFSGGVENPLGPIMLIHVIIAGIILPRGQCYLVATAGTLLFAVMAFGEWSGMTGHYTLTVFPHHVVDGHVVHAAHHGPYVLSRVGLHGAILFLTAFFATTLAARIRDGERELEGFADRLLTQSQMLEQALETTGASLRVRDRALRQAGSDARWAWDEQGTETGEAAEPLASAAVHTLQDGRVRVTDVVVSRPAGADPGAGALVEDRIFRVTTAPLLDKSGSVSHVAELAQDITEQKRAERMLVRTERLAAVGELAGKVAHEVNNPIGVISAKARLLLADEADGMSQRTSEELAKIVSLADRVAGIARGLLSYGRPSSAARAPLDVGIPVRRALANIAPAARATRVEVVERMAEQLPPVRANGGEIEQVFLNLCLNALDAMPHGGTLTVSAAVRRAPGSQEVAVTLEDSGFGIPLHARDRIFEPFWTTKEEGKGTGLGLSICLGLVQSHGGRIDFDSELGRGTRFTVVLPGAAAAAEAAP